MPFQMNGLIGFKKRAGLSYKSVKVSIHKKWENKKNLTRSDNRHHSKDFSVCFQSF